MNQPLSSFLKERDKDELIKAWSTGKTIAECLEVLLNSGYDLVVGSRHLTNKDYQKRKIKTFVKGLISKYGNMLVRAFSGVDLHDYSANFRIIRNEVWKGIKTEEKTNSILLEMIVKTAYKGYKITEIPVGFLDRKYGKSKINLFKEVPKFFIKLVYYSLKYRQLR